MHRGTVGAAALNATLQETLNPHGEPVGSTGLRVGDKVMQIRNNYDLEVFNGDLGLVVAWNATDRVLEVRFDERILRYEPGDLNELVLAYACTVHKSQGNEYPVVILVLHRQHHVMLQRNLLYTAVTRARRQVVVLGEPGALRTALSNNRVQVRWTRLAERLLHPPQSGRAPAPER
jgi:exodeoxyribonuclease V alpha subunit